MKNFDKLYEIVMKECSNCKVADMYDTGSSYNPDEDFAIMRIKKSYQWTVALKKIQEGGFVLREIGSHNGKDELYVAVNKNI